MLPEVSTRIATALVRSFRSVRTSVGPSKIQSRIRTAIARKRKRTRGTLGLSANCASRRAIQNDKASMPIPRHAMSHTERYGSKANRVTVAGIKFQVPSSKFQINSKLQVSNLNSRYDSWNLRLAAPWELGA